MQTNVLRWFTRWVALGVSTVAVLGLALAGTAAARPSAAGALSPEECAALVAEGEQAREDLATLIENLDAQDPSVTTTTSPEIASYVADLIASASINTLGFVSADAGEPLDVCLPEGTTTLTMFSHPVVLWQGEATFDAYPVTVTIPADAACGAHTMQATGPGVDESTQFTVGGTCAAAEGTALPRTGQDIARTVAIGLSLLAIGVAILSARRSPTSLS